MSLPERLEGIRRFFDLHNANWGNGLILTHNQSQSIPTNYLQLPDDIPP